MKQEQVYKLYEMVRANGYIETLNLSRSMEEKSEKEYAITLVLSTCPYEKDDLRVELKFDEVKDFAECGLCGTAAVISPVGKIVNKGEEICLPSGMDEMGPVTKKLYDTLTGIQMGRIEAPKGWIVEI